MRKRILLGILIFVIGLEVGNLVSSFTHSRFISQNKKENISLVAGINLAYSSYLLACTQALDAKHTAGDQYKICQDSAQNYLENNIFSILRQSP